MPRRTDWQMAVRWTSWMPKHLSPRGQRPTKTVCQQGSRARNTCTFRERGSQFLPGCIKVRREGEGTGRGVLSAQFSFSALPSRSVPDSSAIPRFYTLLSKTNPWCATAARTRLPFLVRLKITPLTIASFGVAFVRVEVSVNI